MGVCNVLLTVCEAAFENLFSGLKNNRWVGDFQVATGGGFWVATRDCIIYKNNLTNRQEFISKLNNIISVPPLSKFGIEPVIKLKNSLNKIDITKTLYGYTNTNTHYTIGKVKIDTIPKTARVLSPIKVAVVESDFE